MTDKKPRGLACLTPERRREIASMGGKKGANNPNRPWARDPDLARENAKKGGLTRRKEKPTQ